MNAPSFNSDEGRDHAEPRVAEWLSKAADDLGVAKTLLATGDVRAFDAVCFHCQQGAEKLLKAVLEARGLDVPKVHDLVNLHGRVSNCLPGWQFSAVRLSDLSSMAVETRYPGFRAARADAKVAFETASELWESLRPLV